MFEDVFNLKSASRWVGGCVGGSYFSSHFVALLGKTLICLTETETNHQFPSSVTVCSVAKLNV